MLLKLRPGGNMRFHGTFDELLELLELFIYPAAPRENRTPIACSVPQRPVPATPGDFSPQRPSRWLYVMKGKRDKLRAQGVGLTQRRPDRHRDKLRTQRYAERAATVRGKMAKVLWLAILDRLKNGRFCWGFEVRWPRWPRWPHIFNFPG